jgi:hypothetical protein
VTQGTSAKRPARTLGNANFNAHTSVDFTAANVSLPINGALSLRHIFVVANHPSTTFSTFQNLASFNGGTLWQGNNSTADWNTGGAQAGTNVRDGVATATALSVANRAHLHERVLNANLNVNTWAIGCWITSDLGRQWGGGIVRVLGFSVEKTGTELSNVRALLKSLYGTP